MGVAIRFVLGSEGGGGKCVRISVGIVTLWVIWAKGSVGIANAGLENAFLQVNGSASFVRCDVIEDLKKGTWKKNCHINWWFVMSKLTSQSLKKNSNFRLDFIDFLKISLSSLTSIGLF